VSAVCAIIIIEFGSGGGATIHGAKQRKMLAAAHGSDDVNIIMPLLLMDGFVSRAAF